MTEKIDIPNESGLPFNISEYSTFSREKSRLNIIASINTIFQRNIPSILENNKNQGEIFCHKLKTKH
jgi:hypothetical protein